MTHPALAALLARPIAHRGLHDRTAGRVENSLEAADAAIAAGYGIECDVRLSRDGEAIVFHDAALDRLTAATGPLETFDAAALAAMPLVGGGCVPTLAALLARIDGRVPLVIEVKSGFAGALPLAARTAALVAPYRGAVAIKSFDAAVVARCREAGATCPLGLVGPAGGAREPLAAPFDFLSWRVDSLAALRTRERTAPLMSWTVRSAAEAKEATRWGAQMVFEHFEPEAGRNPYRADSR